MISDRTRLISYKTLSVERGHVDLHTNNGDIKMTVGGSNVSAIVVTINHYY